MSSRVIQNGGATTPDERKQHRDSLRMGKNRDEPAGKVVKLGSLPRQYISFRDGKLTVTEARSRRKT